MTSLHVCLVCEATKGLKECGLCHSPVCKNCVHDLAADAFSFMPKVPPHLTLGLYCPNCFDERVAAEKTKYDATYKLAKEIYFLTKDYPGHIRVMRRHTKRVEVPACDDRRETILRMAFFAAELGMNAIIESSVKSHKMRDGKYQKTRWEGSAMPAIIDGEQLERTSLKRI